MMDSEGMTLRDQFAMAALPSCMDQIWSRCLRNKTQVENVYEVAAAAAYEQADAMMAERRKTMFEATEEQKPATAVAPQGVGVYEALRQLVNYVDDMDGHAEVARTMQPNTWAEQPDHPMTLARAALESGSVHHAGDTVGWIAWNGGKCPVMPDVLVQARLRDATVLSFFARDFNWLSSGQSAGDIVAYRVVRP